MKRYMIFMTKKQIFIFFLFFIFSFLLYLLPSSRMLTFDADQEFYAYQYVRIFREYKITLLGIETSIGGMFVGPLYTYFSALIYFLFHGNPLGIFYVTFFILSFQAGLVYRIFTVIKREKVGIIAGLVTLFSSSLWNKAYAPSVINFLFPMGLLFLFCLVQAKENKKYIIWLGVLLGLSLHLHFSLFLFYPIVIIYFFLRHLFNRHNFKELLSGSLIILIFLSPLIFFDIRHQFFIIKNLLSFLSKSIFSHTASINILTRLLDIPKSLINVFAYFISVRPNIFVYGLLIGVFVYFLRQVKKDRIMQLIALMFGIAILLFTIYSGPVPDYYFYFLLAPFIYVFASFITELGKYKIIRIPVYLFLIYLILENLQFMNNTFNPYSLDKKWDAAKYIKSEAGQNYVKVLYDTDLGLGFGFNYLLDYEKVKKTETDYKMLYQIIIRGKNYPGSVEFREKNSPVAVQVIKLDANQLPINH